MKSKIRPKPVVGQVIYELHRQELTPVIVRKVGYKYFTCGFVDASEYSYREYHIDDWSEKTRYMPDTYLYESVQEYEDEKEHNALLREVREVFVGYSTKDLSLEQLRAIKEIISPGGDN